MSSLEGLVEQEGPQYKASFMLPKGAKYIWLTGAVFGTGYAYDQLFEKPARREDVKGWAEFECLRFMYLSNDPQLFRQIFQEGFTCAYPRMKAALQESRYRVAPDLDRATRFWLFNDYWTIRYVEQASSAVILLASQADRQVSVG